ncbi:MAG: leucyl aminopeptidase [Gammaproteobacteria bacterium]
MDFSIKTGDPEKQRTAAVIVGVYTSRRMSAAARQLDKASRGHIGNALRSGDIKGAAGDTLMLFDVPRVAAERVLLVGCGREADFDATAYRKALDESSGRLRKSGAKSAVSYLPELPVKDRDLAWKIRQAASELSAALYTFDKLKSNNDKDKPALTKAAFAVSSKGEVDIAKRALVEGEAIASGMSLTRDLGNLPGNICTPVYLAQQAQDLKRGRSKLKCTVLGEKEMENLGMGALLSVSRGSRQPARLIAVEYRGAKSKGKPQVLVGKGITFDTGGISIKPGAAMDEMKFDMCGAASVLGTMAAIDTMDLPLNVVGIMACAENMPGGEASRPGDIVTTMSGQTVEILNTDAEGRLVLCDALTYAERYDPATVIDVATLTGAAIVALGHHASGLMGNDDALAQDLLGAGSQSGDRAWQLPLWDEYQKQLKSNFADMANIGGRPAGTITAACFLSRFTKKYRWAHLDIAGTAWHSGDRKGATGRPVPLLTQYLMDRANS